MRTWSGVLSSIFTFGLNTTWETQQQVYRQTGNYGHSVKKGFEAFGKQLLLGFYELGEVIADPEKLKGMSNAEAFMTGFGPFLNDGLSLIGGPALGKIGSIASKAGSRIAKAATKTGFKVGTKITKQVGKRTAKRAGLLSITIAAPATALKATGSRLATTFVNNTSKGFRNTLAKGLGNTFKTFVRVADPFGELIEEAGQQALKTATKKTIKASAKGQINTQLAKVSGDIAKNARERGILKETINEATGKVIQDIDDDFTNAITDVLYTAKQIFI